MRSLLELVAYKSGRKESFGCIWAKKKSFLLDKVGVGEQKR